MEERDYSKVLYYIISEDKKNLTYARYNDDNKKAYFSISIDNENPEKTIDEVASKMLQIKSIKFDSEKGEISVEYENTKGNLTASPKNREDLINLYKRFDDIKNRQEKIKKEKKVQDPYDIETKGNLGNAKKRWSKGTKRFVAGVLAITALIGTVFLTKAVVTRNNKYNGQKIVLPTVEPKLEPTPNPYSFDEKQILDDYTEGFDITDPAVLDQKAKEFKEELNTKTTLNGIASDDKLLKSIINLLNGNYDYFSEFNENGIENAVVNAMNAIMEIEKSNIGKTTESGFVILSRLIGNNTLFANDIVHFEDRMIRYYRSLDYQNHATWMHNISGNNQYYDDLKGNMIMRMIALSIVRPSYIKDEKDKNKDIYCLETNLDTYSIGDEMYYVSDLTASIEDEFNSASVSVYNGIVENCIPNPDKGKD